MSEFMESIGLFVDNIDNDEPVNIFFEENGFQSKQFLNNAGSTLIFLMSYIFELVLFFVVQRIAEFRRTFIPLKNKLQSLLIWN
jgi:hypothetical protein